MEKGTEMTLRLCESFEKFDSILNQMGLKTDLDKIAYLEKMFDVKVVHATDNNKHTDYVAIANAIMNHQKRTSSPN